jgi:hypothetical protein
MEATLLGMSYLVNNINPPLKGGFFYFKIFLIFGVWKLITGIFSLVLRNWRIVYSPAEMDIKVSVYLVTHSFSQ